MQSFRLQSPSQANIRVNENQAMYCTDIKNDRSTYNKQIIWWEQTIQHKNNNNKRHNTHSQ